MVLPGDADLYGVRDPDRIAQEDRGSPSIRDLWHTRIPVGAPSTLCLLELVPASPETSSTR